MSHGMDILREAIHLQDLQTNTSLLDYGLHMGLIERSDNGQMTMELLNIKLMSGGEVVRNVLIELLMRMGVFVSATGLVKLAIDSEEVDLPEEQEDVLRCFYVLSIIAHQVVNFDVISVRTINRLLMSIAIILFSLTNSYSAACDDMKKFKHKIRHRLAIDYYLWCLLFAMDLVLTCSAPIHINLEQQYGTELNISHVMLSSYCVIHLSSTMQMIGHGRLSPLIIGTPLIFLDAGDAITLVKGLFLILYYLCFWCSDWRELVDWNHSMLCEAGICKILATENNNLRSILKKAKSKFDEWRLEEGLDDDGWFILVDAPPIDTAPINTRSNVNSNNDHDDDGAGGGGNAEDELAPDDEPAEDDHIVLDGIEENYRERMVYLQSRNPLLTSLAAIMLIVWK